MSTGKVLSTSTKTVTTKSTKAPATKAPATKAPISNAIWAGIAVIIIITAIPLLVAFWPRAVAADPGAANSRADAAEAQLATANSRADAAEAQLATANSRADAAEAQLATANDQLAATVVTKFALGLPNLIDFREAVIQNGDENSANIIFGRDYPSLILLRAVADDQFLELTFHRNNGTAIDLLPMLKMQMMDNKFFASLTSQELQALKDRGINVQLGEILAQNLNSIDLGKVSQGEYISILLKDDILLGANNGTIITFGDAPEQIFTVPLNK